MTESFIERGLDARLERDDELNPGKVLKTSHAVRNFPSSLIRLIVEKQAENDKKIEKIKIKMAEGFIAECLAVRHDTDDELTPKKYQKTSHAVRNFLSSLLRSITS